jgi:predicted HAD superfamily Cof-like phosphohydrolase
MKETFVADVTKFEVIAGRTTDKFHVRQIAFQIGMQLEEMAEKLEAIFQVNQTMGDLRMMSGLFKDGTFDRLVKDADRKELLDADVDIAWVTNGSMLAQGADILGAIGEVTRANLDKFPGGVVTKDANGKIMKPENWRGPDLSPFVNTGEAVYK